MAKKNPSVPSYASRRNAAMRAAQKSQPIDAYLITRPEDVAYFTGFSGEDSFVLFGKDWACLLTDGRYDEQARKECGEIEIHLRHGAMAAAIAETLNGRRVKRLGLQAGHVTLAMFKTLESALSVRKLIPLEDVPARLRQTKDDSEISAIRKAIRVAEQAMRELLSGGAKHVIGRSEEDLAAELDYRMRKGGASGPSFETIVAAGANASMPHYRPGKAKVRRNQAVLFDWGARVNGYCSDLTRVVGIGTIPPKLAEMYEIVLRAQQAGIQAIASGVKLSTADAAARKVIEEAGYGDCFTHSLGHGFGRVVHEMPALARPAKGRFRKGMVVTVEPGIYVPGLGGIRIEDDILVTLNGGKRLSSLPRDLKSMTLG